MLDRIFFIIFTILALDVGFNEAKGVKIAGRIKLPKSFDKEKFEKEERSCFIVYIQKERKCSTSMCYKPVLSTRIYKNPFIHNNYINYLLKVPSFIDAGTYLISATLNIGWCKTSTEWIKVGDYKQKRRETIDLYHGQVRAEKSDIKMVEYGVTPVYKVRPSIQRQRNNVYNTVGGVSRVFIQRNKRTNEDCKLYDLKVYKSGERFISADCSGWCQCNDGAVGCVSLCPPVVLGPCPPGHVVQTFDSPIRGSNCTCSRERCERIQGNLAPAYSPVKPYQLVGYVETLPKLTEIHPNSCLNIIVKDNIVCNENEVCNNNVEAELLAIDLSNTRIVNGKFKYAVNVQQARAGELIVEAVLNVGWCPVDRTQDWLHTGDYLNKESLTYSVRVGSKNKYLRKDLKVHLNA